MPAVTKNSYKDMNRTASPHSKITRTAAVVGLTLVLASQGLTGCSKTAPTPPAASSTPVASPVDDPSPIELVDGRKSSQASVPPNLTQEAVDSLAREAERAAKDPALAGLLEGGDKPTTQGFQVVDAAEGSFTHPGSSQHIYLYHLGSTGGLVVLENNAVVGHFSGGPGDYARYIKITALDADSDGWSELILERNVEDSDDTLAYLFKMSESGPLFQGESPLYLPGGAPDAQTPPSEQTSTAYLITVAADQAHYSRKTFLRKGSGEWTETVPERTPVWTNRYSPGEEPNFLNLLRDLVDPARLKAAIGKLDSYADVPSAIDFANPKNEAEMLVATDPTLQLMEILDTRAAVYAYENATKEEVNRSEASRFALSLEGLKTTEEIKQAYIRRTNESLGGESPYQ